MRVQIKSELACTYLSATQPDLTTGRVMTKSRSVMTALEFVAGSSSTRRLIRCRAFAEVMRCSFTADQVSVSQLLRLLCVMRFDAVLQSREPRLGPEHNYLRRAPGGGRRALHILRAKGKRYGLPVSPGKKWKGQRQENMGNDRACDIHLRAHSPPRRHRLLFCFSFSLPSIVRRPGTELCTMSCSVYRHDI